MAAHKGHIKAGGRRKGTPNKAKAYLAKSAILDRDGLKKALDDAGCDLVGALVGVAATGKLIDGREVSVNRVLDVQMELLAKLIPSLKAVELSGPSGGAIPVDLSVLSDDELRVIKSVKSKLVRSDNAPTD